MSGQARTKLALLLVIVACLIPPAGCSENPVTGKRQILLISREQEIAMGEEAAPRFEEEFGGKVPDESLQRYVGAIGQKVSSHSDRPMPYEFVLVRSDVPNAFALPGGKIFITAGLMRRMTNERQLASVLAHETGHVAARHNVMGMQRQMGAAVLVKVAGVLAGEDKQQMAEAVAKVVSSMANLRYSRDDEYLADTVGVRYMALAGYNPWGMVEMLTVLQGLSESEPGSLAELFGTHPLTSKRIDNARRAIEADEACKPFSPDAPDRRAGRFLKMRDRLARYVAKAD